MEDIASWTASQKQTAAERHMQILAKILEVLATNGPLTFVELREKCGAGAILTRKLLNRGEMEGSILRTREHLKVQYCVANSVRTSEVSRQVPVVRDYKNRHRPYNVASSDYLDSRARLKALERRRAGHAALCDKIATHFRAGGLRTQDSDYIDLLINGNIIIEVKTLESDDLRQVRSAISQLLFYRFVYRTEISGPLLVAAFSRRPALPLGSSADFLQECGIESLWVEDGKFVGTDVVMQHIGRVKSAA